MSDFAAPTVRAGLSRARPVSVVLIGAALVLFGLTYYGVVLALASAPHLQNLDRAMLHQAEQIKRLSGDVTALKAENAGLREQLSAAQRLYGAPGYYGSDWSDSRRSLVATPFASK